MITLVNSFTISTFIIITSLVIREKIVNFMME